MSKDKNLFISIEKVNGGYIVELKNKRHDIIPDSVAVCNELSEVFDVMSTTFNS